VNLWTYQMETVENRAKWIGVATHAANNHLSFPYRDSEAAQWRANAARRARNNAKAGIDGRRRKRPKQSEVAADEGGHVLAMVASGKGWFCTVCRMRTRTRKRLAITKCSKAGTKTWLKAEPDKVVSGTGIQEWGSGRGGERQHRLARSGTIVWCSTCGCFAETRANGLIGSCSGPPPRSQGSSGRRSQLNRLNANLHPVTCTGIPPAKRIDGTGIMGDGTYRRRLGRRIPEVKDFTPYVPAIFQPAAPVMHGITAAEKRARLKDRILAKQLQSKRVERTLKKESIKAEADELIRSFVHGGGVDDQMEYSCEVCSSDSEMRQFWDQVCPMFNSMNSKLANVESPQKRSMQARGVKPSRASRLNR
jgi:hypothetical protein